MLERFYHYNFCIYFLLNQAGRKLDLNLFRRFSCPLPINLEEATMAATSAAGRAVGLLCPKVHKGHLIFQRSVRHFFWDEGNACYPNGSIVGEVLSGLWWY